MRYHSESEQDTYDFAYELAGRAKPGDIYRLEGDLGVGKTVFAKGFARGLGITEPIVSPTFTIIQEYDEGRLPLYHFDVYRIADVEEMYEMDCEGYLYGDGVCLIEWATVIEDILPDTCHTIHISKDMERGFDYRCIDVDGDDD